MKLKTIVSMMAAVFILPSVSMSVTAAEEKYTFYNQSGDDFYVCPVDKKFNSEGNVCERIELRNPTCPEEFELERIGDSKVCIKDKVSLAYSREDNIAISMMKIVDGEVTYDEGAMHLKVLADGVDRVVYINELNSPVGDEDIVRDLLSLEPDYTYVVGNAKELMLVDKEGNWIFVADLDQEQQLDPNDYDYLGITGPLYKALAQDIACEEGRLVNSQCEVPYDVEPATPTLSLVKRMMYYSAADDVPASEDNPEELVFSRDKALFRFLDDIYKKDSNGDIYNRIVSSDRTDIIESIISFDWARKDDIESFLSELIKRSPDNVEYQNALLDYYYNESLLLLIGARVSLEFSEMSIYEDRDLDSAISDVEVTVEALFYSVNRYINVLTSNPDFLIRLSPNRFRKDMNIYDDAGKLVHVIEANARTGYKDIKLMYQIMAEFMDSITTFTKLHAQKNAVMDTIGFDNFVMDYVNQLDDLVKMNFPEYMTLNQILDSELYETITEFEVAKAKLENVKNWQSGESNILNIPNDTLLLYGAGAGEFNFDSYEKFNAYLAGSSSPLFSAVRSFEEAKVSYENYRLTSDNLKTEFNDRTEIYNTQLFDLVGLEYNPECEGESCFIKEGNSVYGSAISVQQRNIALAINAIEQAEQELEKKEQQIYIEIERLSSVHDVNLSIADIQIEYGEMRVTLAERMAEIKIELEKYKRKKSFFSSALNVVQGVARMWAGDYVGGGSDFINGITGAITANSDAEKNIDAITDIAELNALRDRYAAEEQATLTFLNATKEEINSLAYLSQLRLDITGILLQIASSDTALQRESEVLAGMLLKSKQVVLNMMQSNENLLDRYFADPIHATRMTKDIVKANSDFERAQKWLFYATKALEYKWQTKFEDSFSGYNLDSIFTFRSALELENYYLALSEFNERGKSIHYVEQMDIFSLKENVFDITSNYESCYLSSGEEEEEEEEEGEGEGEGQYGNCFTEKLEQSRNESVPGWLTFEFSTAKEIPQTNLFQGPITASDDNGKCIIDAGNYMDKIDFIEVIVEANQSSVDTLLAKLTYGGTSVFRNEIPGLETADDGISIIDEFNSSPVQFMSQNQATGSIISTSSYRESFSANVDSGSNNLPPMKIYTFKERSVAATGWRLSIQVEDQYGDSLVNLEDIQDIQLKFNHRYVSRQFSNCESNPLIVPLSISE